MRTLQAYLMEQFRGGSRVLLIIDEAHGLSDELLEEVRLLSNFETPQSKLLYLLLVGQPELSQRLDLSHLRPLRQRIAHRFELGPLELTETLDYIRTRIAVARGGAVEDSDGAASGPRFANGDSEDLFSPGAYAAVYRFSGGLPRLINTVCDNALVTAYARNESIVSSRAVAAAVGQLSLAPVQSVGMWQRLRIRRHVSPEAYSLGMVTNLGLNPLPVRK